MKFFHATTSQRKRKNKIVGLKNKLKEWKDDKENIEKTILDWSTLRIYSSLIILPTLM